MILYVERTSLEEKFIIPGQEMLYRIGKEHIRPTSISLTIGGIHLCALHMYLQHKR